MRRFIVSSIAAVAVAASAVTFVTTSDAVAQARGERTVTITVNRVRAIDAVDAFSKADFFARVTINGVAVETQPIKQQADISPNWQIVHKVPNGRHDVTLEIFDKDLTKVEPIDINRVDNKRKLDFTVDTRSCSVSGLTGISRCGQTIVRAGAERKKAEVTFTVGVSR